MILPSAWITHPVTQCHLPEHLNLQQHHCQNINSSKQLRYFHYSIIIIIIIIIIIQPLGQFGQEPEPSQVTGMALVCYILGKFLGVVCHCFPLRLDVPTFATRCFHVRNDVRDPSSERWNYG